MGKLKFNCESCGCLFFTKKGDRKRTPKFCSRQCCGKSIIKWIKCKQCGKLFHRFTNNEVTHGRIFCSYKCAGEFRQGKPLSESWKKALAKAHIGKNTGKRSKAFGDKVSKALLGKPQPWNRNEKHHAWKGEKSGYTSFHAWLSRNYGRADRCDNPTCKYPKKIRGKWILKPKRFEWSILHGESHDHKRSSYWRLCCSCHRRYDMR